MEQLWRQDEEERAAALHKVTLICGIAARPLLTATALLQTSFSLDEGGGGAAAADAQEPDGRAACRYRPCAAARGATPFRSTEEAAQGMDEASRRSGGKD